ncbi:MAG: multidrug efflux SMR transporter [Pelagibacterales bacterium]|nr:multidrug efflux SMR transporter [Pelagibacterales bacterium]
MSLNFAWIALIVAGIFEVVWAYFLKQSHGFTKVFPVVLFIITLAISMILLAYAVKQIPISIAYPIWVGIGAVGSVIIGVLFFGESLNLISVLFLALLISGIVGLKFFS